MELVKLSYDVGLLVIEILKKKGHEPRTNKHGLLSFEFTQEELDQIRELSINNPRADCLTNLEYLRNLEKLKITSSYSAYSNNNPSISNRDIKTISKITSLRVLTLSNQSKISWVYLDNLVNLESLTIIRNNRLECVLGLDKLKKIHHVAIYGNKELYELPHIKELILSNEVELLDLDLLHYPEISDLKGKLSKIVACNFVEYGVGHHISYGWGTAKILNDKCLRIVKEIVDKSRNVEETLILIEKYLAENITYDHDALKTDDRIHTHNGKRVGFKHGTQSAYNGLMLGSCVCEGYSRSMQYLLKLLGIRTKNVSCIGGKDQISINKRNHNKITLPDDGYHSIIRIELNSDIYYCDPCWDSCHWHWGDKSLPYCLKSKKDIMEDHTLSFEEDNITTDSVTTSVSSDYIREIVEREQAGLEKQSQRKR